MPATPGRTRSVEGRAKPGIGLNDGNNQRSSEVVGNNIATPGFCNKARDHGGKLPEP